MHEGHRERMREKLENGQYMPDHELLEMLLYNAQPRQNTNPVAHALMEKFLTLPAVFAASVKELTAVKGVGQSLAAYIRTIGLCFERVNPAGGGIMLKNMGECKEFIKRRMHGLTEEHIQIYLTRKNGRIVRILDYCSYEFSKASVPADEVCRDISSVKPFGLIIAHNHLSGTSSPSVNDDTFTKEIQLICSINNVELLDHLIYAGGDDVYSYFAENRLDAIKREINLQKAVKWMVNG